MQDILKDGKMEDNLRNLQLSFAKQKCTAQGKVAYIDNFIS